MDAAEYERRHARLQVLAEFFRKRSGQWVDSIELELIAGRCAWRSRVSECRTKLGMTVENRQTRIKKKDGFAVLSEYRFLPHEPLGRDASTQMPTYQPELFIR